MKSVFSVAAPSPAPWNTVTLLTHYDTDTVFETKVDLIRAVYRKDDGKPWALPVVRRVEASLASEEDLNYEYLPTVGLDRFCTAVTSFILGKESKAIKENRVFSVQTLGCTGALHLGATFLAQHLKAKQYYYSAQTWEGTIPIFESAGFEKGLPYRYWHADKRNIDIDGLLEDLSNAEPNSIVLLQACAHNPTGCDPTFEQWVLIADLMKKKKLFPFFDAVALGLASGDFEKDARVVRYFVDQGFEMLCASSFSKNMNLYSQRIGNLIFVTNETDVIPRTRVHVMNIIRGRYLNPPSHGSRLVSTILNDSDMLKEWEECVKTMCAKMKLRRERLRDKLRELGTPGNWDHIVSQTGMVSLTGLSPSQIEYARTKHHVYILNNGRIAISMLTTKNLDHVAYSFHDAIINVKE